MKTAHWPGLLALPVVLALAGCGGGPEKKDAAGKEYEVKGTVVAVDAEKKSITLDHEEIPGLMKAMKMQFTLDSPKVAEGVRPEDRVQGRLRVQGSNYVITKLEKR